MGLDKYIMMSVHHCSIIQSSFTKSHVFHLFISPCALILGNHCSFYCLHVFAFSRMPYSLNYTDFQIVFPDCLLSLNDRHLRSLHDFSGLDCSCQDWIIFLWMCHSVVTHPPTEGHLGCFHVLATLIKAAVNICTRAFVWTFFFTLSSCSTQAQWSCARAWLLCGMWDLPGPGIELTSPALQGGLLTTGPQGKPWITLSWPSSSRAKCHNLGETCQLLLPVTDTLLFAHWKQLGNLLLLPLSFKFIEHVLTNPGIHTSHLLVV